MRYSTFIESMNFGMSWNSRDRHFSVWRKGRPKPERWVWLTDHDRAEIVRELDRLRKYDSFIKRLSQYASPDPEHKQKTRKFEADVPRCHDCGARLDGRPDKCPSCDEPADYDRSFDYVNI